MRSPLALALLLLPATALAQPERYELGRRLRQYEAAWEEQPDAAARKKALAGLPKLTPQFFGLKFGEAGRTLDDARFALAKEPPADAQKWAAALYAVPEKRVLDGTTTELRVTIRSFYPMPGGVPEGARATLTVGRRMEEGRSVVASLDKLPVTVTVPVRRLPRGTGDYTLEFAVRGRDMPYLTGQWTTVSVVDRLIERIAAVRTAAQELEAAGGASLETATVRDLADAIEETADGTVPETDVRFASALEQAESMLAELAKGEKRFAPHHPGDNRISIPTGKTRTVPCRLFVPRMLRRDKPVPLVIALHGAGGTENLFFDGYGAGRIVKEGADRGWLLVAPRCGFVAGPPADVIIDRRAERYPIDRKRVFLVGHSMGAAQTIGLIQAHPGRFAAAACLGGGGRVTDPKPFAGLPVFVGVGDQDFALAGAKGLAKALTGAGAAVTAKEYPGLEHLVIVRESLPDVFAGFDKIRAGEGR